MLVALFIFLALAALLLTTLLPALLTITMALLTALLAHVRLAGLDLLAATRGTAKSIFTR